MLTSSVHFCTPVMCLEPALKILPLSVTTWYCWYLCWFLYYNRDNGGEAVGWGGFGLWTVPTELKTGQNLLQERILKLVEHVVFVLRYIPSAELEALIILLKDSPDTRLASLILATLNKLVSCWVCLGSCDQLPQLLYLRAAVCRSAFYSFSCWKFDIARFFEGIVCF